jgi:hypothetical protein
MYAYWFPPAGMVGKDLLLVASSRDMVEEKFFITNFESMDDIQELEIKKNGQFLDRFYIRLARGFHRD